MKLTESEAWGILELEPGADKPTIRQAYLELVNVWHPDRFRGKPRLEAKAQEKLKRINAAYERLHDVAGQAGSRPQSAHKNPAPPKPREERRSSPRVKLRIPIHHLSSLDLSRGGIAIRTSNPLGHNEKVPLRFRVPGSNSEINVEARIVWGIPAFGIGLQFEKVKPVDQATLARFVDTHASGTGILAVCSQCRALLRVALEDIGRVVRCRCKHEFPVF